MFKDLKESMRIMIYRKESINKNRNYLTEPHRHSGIKISKLKN